MSASKFARRGRLPRGAVVGLVVGLAACGGILLSVGEAPSPIRQAAEALERDPRGAEILAEIAAAEDSGVIPLRDFLLGNAAYAKGEAALVLAEGPEPPPAAFERPIRETEAALELWARAAASRDDWPAARRNAERALLRLAELRARRAEAQQRREHQPPPPGPGEDPGAEGEGADTRVATVTTELDVEALGSLLDRLREKEEERRTLRRSLRRPGVGGDW